MSESSQVDDGSDASRVLAVVRDLVELMLRPADPEQDDEDVADALLAGLRVLVPTAEVLTARFARNRRADLRMWPTHDVARLEALGETEESLFDALSAVHPAMRHGPGGEVIALIAPLVLRAGAVELVVLRSTSRSGLSDTEALAFTTLRDLANAAVAGRQARDEARLDALTGCLNHGAMHAQLAKEVARVDRAGGRLACVMLDLDDFKAVNERHGHPVGDEVLRAVSVALSAECRRYDSCCRYGGDEFLVILPNSDMRNASAAADRMRAAVARAAIRVDGEEIAVNATTGVAVWRTGESAADLVIRADQALFRGKASREDDEGS